MRKEGVFVVEEVEKMVNEIKERKARDMGEMEKKRNKKGEKRGNISESVDNCQCVRCKTNQSWNRLERSLQWHLRETGPSAIYP